MIIVESPLPGVNAKRPPVASGNMTYNQSAITWKRCKIGGKLVLITNRKSHMGFPLEPNLVTLNGVVAV